MGSYSYAGPNRGKANPSDIIAVHVDESTCPKDRCAKRGEHLVIIWTGNGYTRRNTWISAEKRSFVDLEDFE